jgi:hypothetical protein
MFFLPFLLFFFVSRLHFTVHVRPQEIGFSVFCSVLYHSPISLQCIFIQKTKQNKKETITNCVEYDDATTKGDSYNKFGGLTRLRSRLLRTRLTLLLNFGVNPHQNHTMLRLNKSRACFPKCGNLTVPQVAVEACARGGQGGRAAIVVFEARQPVIVPIASCNGCGCSRNGRERSCHSICPQDVLKLLPRALWAEGDRGQATVHEELQPVPCELVVRAGLVGSRLRLFSHEAVNVRESARLGGDSAYLIIGRRRGWRRGARHRQVGGGGRRRT